MKEKINHQLVTVIVLSYKNLNYIKETIDSILTQDYPNMELIVSDDNTEEFDGNIYTEYIEKNNNGNIKNLIVHKNEENLGLVKNANNAAKMSKGDIIKFIAADDAFYCCSIITSFVRFIETNNSYVVASKVVACDEKLNVLKDNPYDKVFDHILKPTLTNFNRKKCLLQLSIGSFIPAPGVCFIKEVFEKYGYFDETYRLIEDWPMWLKLVREGCKIDCLDEMTVKYRTNVGISMTPNETFREENIQCFKNQVNPYINDFGYWAKKKIKWYNTRKWEYDRYTIVEKVKFVIKNIDLILIHLIPNKFKKLICDVKI